MSKKTTIRLRYTGEAVDDHNMDVTHLGSSLFAVGELCKLANWQFNQNDANVHVFVRTDKEHHCFEIVLEVFQSFLANAHQIIGSPVTTDIKEILEWIGIYKELVGGGVGGGVGLYKFLRWKKDRKIDPTTVIENEKKGTVTITIDPDDAITIKKETWELSKNKEVVKMAGKAIAPLQKDGYSSMEFEGSDKSKQRITKEEAKDIITSVKSYDAQQLTEPQIIEAWLSVYSPVYKADAKKWRFLFGGSVEYFDISNTDIAKEAIQRGGAFTDDLYHVKAEITQSLNQSGKIKNEYSIIEVIEFKQVQQLIQTEIEQVGIERKRAKRLEDKNSDS